MRQQGAIVNHSHTALLTFRAAGPLHIVYFLLFTYKCKYCKTNMAPSPVDEQTLLELEQRSNKGASKQRRDQINNEISVMRDLLPLPESARQRLSQLQIMSLSCVFIRKCNILQKLFHPSPSCTSESICDFSQSLTGFLLVTTRDGKLVFISENVTEYLGHSMVDMKTQGDSLFDIVDKRDHGTVRAQLMNGGSDVESDHQISFFCRMNMSRTLKRQAGFGDVKVMHVKGHFANVPGQEPGSEQQVFLAICTPLITPDVKESLIQNNTMVFKSVHKLDMNFIEITQNGEYHLGITNDEISNKSWYSYLHPEDIYEAREKHVQLIKSRHEMGCMMTVRMITPTNDVIWVNIVMHVRQALLPGSDDPVILCVNQVISEQEAYQFKIQGQLFALYASRAPEFFFGTAFCAPMSHAMDNGIISTQGSGIIPPPFFHRQQTFENNFGPQQASNFMPNHLQMNHSSLFSKNGMSSNIHGRQGHTDTLRALKRKLQENFTSSCKPAKMQRLISNGNGGNVYSPVQESTPLPSSFETGGYRNPMSSVIGGMDQIIPQGSMQVMYAHNLSTVMMSPKEKSPDVIQTFSPPTGLNEKSKSMEQVVPEVTLPACYLTPDPSPVGSPEPPNSLEKCHAAPKLDPVLIAKHLCAIKQKQLTQKSHLVPEHERKLLPSLDATFVDSFFDEIDHVSLTQEEELRLLQFQRERVTVKQEPLDIDEAEHIPTVNTTDISNFDIEDFLQFAEQPNKECNRAVMDVKLERCTDDQQVLTFDSQPSPTPSSPYSTTDEKISHDPFTSLALTPNSSFEGDPFEEVLDGNSWCLENIKVDLSRTPGLKPPAFMIGTLNQQENELHQLKQLISSCAPSGVRGYNEDSQ